MTECTGITKLPVYILAGGKSSRFGSDKARAEFEGKPLLSRLAQMLFPLTSNITVIADVEGKYSDLGYKTIADIIPGLGPIGGIQTAITDYGLQGNSVTVCDGWLLLVSCDLVKVRPEWVAVLYNTALSLSERDYGKSRYEVIAYNHALRGDSVEGTGFVWEPLMALYNIDIGVRVDAHIAQTRLSMHDLIKASKTYSLPVPKDWLYLSQVNTVEDLERLQEKKT